METPSTAEAPAIDPRRLASYQKALRMCKLATLAGIYRSAHYPEVAKMVGRNATIDAMVAKHYEQGFTERRTIGLPAAEHLHAVIPYQLWCAI